MAEQDYEELLKTKKLNAKQEEFCRQYVLSLNQTEAYVRAYGIDRENARKYASRLMTNENVVSRIAELKEENRKKYNFEVGDLISKAMEIYNLAMTGQPQVKLDIKGHPVKTGNIERDLKAGMDALKSIGNWCGLDSQTIKAKVDADVKAQASIMTAKDIAQELMKDD